MRDISSQKLQSSQETFLALSEKVLKHFTHEYSINYLANNK